LPEEFVTKVRSSYRITIPEWIREELGIKVGTKVRVIVDLAKKAATS